MNKFIMYVESKLSPALKEELARKGWLTLFAEVFAVIGGTFTLFIFWLLTSEFIK